MNIFVFGFYRHKNIGDELFVEAFKQLFPHINFTFSDTITIDSIKSASAVFFGGGSFLNSELNISAGCLKLLKTLPIFYVGVGAETQISSSHEVLMRMARLIA